MFFLSASIPSPLRDKKYIDTADIIAIRDAVRALATVVIPKSSLVWGGHPAITPLIRYVLEHQDKQVADHVTLYQSAFFEQFFPEDNGTFEKVVIIPKERNREESLLAMRIRMFEDNAFQAGIFIGGMEGVEDEFNLFKEYHPYAKLIPVASTGAAAKFIYEAMENKPDPRLIDDYAYMAMFRDLFYEYLNP